MRLVVDCGGTSTRAGIFDDDGKLIARGSGGASNPAAAGHDAAIESILTAVRSATGLVDGLPITPFPFDRAWFGISGLDTPSSIPIARRRICEAFRISDDERIIVTNDAHLLSAAIAPRQTGICLIAGTGSIAMAFRVEKGQLPIELGRAGGYGHLLGDEGSAWYVGCEALKRTLAVKIDRRRLLKSDCDVEPSDAFVKRLLQHFGSPSLDDLLDQAVGLDDGSVGRAADAEARRKYRIGDCARLVQASAFPNEARWPHHAPAALGGEPEPFALRILESAVDELTDLVDSLQRRFSIDSRTSTLVIAGGMWTSPGFKRLFSERAGDWASIEQVDEPLLVAGRALHSV